MQIANIIISPLGLILIPVGALLFVWSRRRLLWATVASIPFFFVVVLDLGFTLVKPFQYFGLLLVLRAVIEFVLQRGNRGLSVPPPGAAVRASAAAQLPGLVSGGDDARGGCSSRRTPL